MCEVLKSINQLQVNQYKREILNTILKRMECKKQLLNVMILCNKGKHVLNIQRYLALVDKLVVKLACRHKLANVISIQGNNC